MLLELAYLPEILGISIVAVVSLQSYVVSRQIPLLLLFLAAISELISYALFFGLSGVAMHEFTFVCYKAAQVATGYVKIILFPLSIILIIRGTRPLQAEQGAAANP